MIDCVLGESFGLVGERAVTGFGFRVPDFGIRVSDSGFGIRFSHFGFQTLVVVV